MVVFCQGSTPLIYAAAFNKTEIAKMLLVKGADATVKDARGQTGFDYAKMQGNSQLMELLKHNSLGKP
ncbi:ankyrin repeat domain-containing protein [Flavobacteriaceae bacterium KMM 6897]|nr:ankyrin repeat domain-containing protein [Flavobacteriaceae bacterium KMM 6897]MEB8346038.1 ankyrin repeat domain-containing protein [Flavobacteriaceae bacterium KMM 6898]